MKLDMIDLYPPRTKLSIKFILSGQYMNRGECVMVYTMGGKLAVNEMQRNLMR